MTDSELSAEEKAALLLLRTGGKFISSDNGATWHESYETIESVRIAATIALREHPIDDDEPVTEEWFDSISTREFDKRSRYWLLPNSFGIRFDVECKFVMTFQSRILCLLSTRGDVRRLCRALGIELKESNDGAQ